MNIDNQAISWVVSILTILLGTAGLRGLVVALRTKKEIVASKEEEKKKAAEAAKIIEDTATAAVKRLEEEAISARKKLLVEREEAQKFESECVILRREVNEMKCRLDNDLDACQREIKTLQGEVARLKAKNMNLLSVVEKLVDQVKKRGEIPDCPNGLIGEGE